MTFNIVPLRLFIERHPEQTVEEMLSGFTCSKNKDVQRYLRKTALKHERDRISRTYLIMDTEPEEHLVAYITIAMKCLNIGDEQHNEALMDRMNVNNGIAQSYLIGQLGKIDGYDKKVGEFAFKSALDIIEDASELVGCRVLRLDCKDALVKYYEGKGFNHLNRNAGTDLNRMVMVLA